MSVNLHQALQDTTCHLVSHKDSEDQESTTVEKEQWVSLGKWTCPNGGFTWIEYDIDISCFLKKKTNKKQI